ncbi:dolichyl pyrophosphate Man7GlcNAc2 alpha-1,6-mannosyltransferase Alg12 [Schizosaccharomyces osmophilus]|uniref:Mannosyltransferase n=1 Tax=Schizosaccharomyces osmophilus TaxID=2545709 RepID=A0AAF0AU47_9SCHI|nr:dolichyl pyrophosphate Man7GlcNAc2 alpha-1,6-mannosyltransferase Alg12 [Schizosaccharomyces osmophilus]WBW72106.1 dolichyl pyrophosphate Man7GlcNAc2 alpha-1,6-mannosyltransferase Alg12 [Schizosaccharomyces osmophilus]
MGFSRQGVLWYLANGLLLLLMGYYAFMTPYTKVEESFSMQAIHDIQTYKLDLSKYDHQKFPGPVKRSFIPSLIIAFVSYLPAKHFSSLLAVRWTIGFLSCESFMAVGKALRKRFGFFAGISFLLIAAAQFHLVYYMSRPLPNVYGLVLTNSALTLLLSGKYYTSISVLVFAAVIVRSEIFLLLSVLSLCLLGQRRVHLVRLFVIGVLSSATALAFTVFIDSWFWGTWCWPELQAFAFNVLEGKSSEWGTSPFYYYFIRIPWIMLNPTLFLFGLVSFLTVRSSRILLYVPFAFVFIFSFLKHKEWRFISYILPWIDASCATGFAYLMRPKDQNKMNHNFRKLAFSGLIIGVSFGIFASSLLLKVFTFAYPGGAALEKVHSMNTNPYETVHLDTYPCMTGITRFLQKPNWYYDKEEDSSRLNDDLFQTQFHYIITDTPKLYERNFKVLHIVGEDRNIPVISASPIFGAFKLNISNSAFPVYILVQPPTMTEKVSIQDYNKYIGQPVNNIKNWPEVYRIVKPGGIMTRDYREERLNFFTTDDGILDHITQG